MADILSSKSFIQNILYCILASVFVLAVGEIDALTYTIIFGMSIILISGADFNKYCSRSYYLSLFVCIAFIGFIIGLRDFGVGTDTDVYIRSFFYEAQRIHDIDSFLDYSGDLGFLFLAFLASMFSDDAQSLLVIVELWICLFTFAAVHEINKNGKRAEWSTFLFFWLLTALNVSMNWMRQFCAIAMLMLAFAYLLNGKWKKAVIIQVVSFFFHSSSIVFAPVFFVYYLSKWENVKLRNIYTVGFLLFTLFLTSQVFVVLPLLARYGIISELYSDRYGADSKYEAVNVFGVSIITIYILIYALIYYSNKTNYLSNKDVYMAYTIHSMWIVLKLLALFVIYLARVSEYYFYLDILFIAIMLRNKKTPVWLKGGIYICFIYYWYRTCIVSNSGDTYPFESQILGI